MFLKSIQSRRVLVVFLALFLAAGAMAVAFRLRPAPHIVIEPAEQDLGELPQEHLELVFTVRNEGSAPLQIDSVKTTCGCTEAFIDGDTVPPGGSTLLKVTMDPQRDNLYGSMFRVIFVHSNDPDSPRAEAHFRVAIARP